MNTNKHESDRLRKFDSRSQTPEFIIDILLASGSPRRKQLLEQAGYRVEVCPAQVEEFDDAGFPVQTLVLLNAVWKAGWVARDHPQRLVLAADTLVALNGKALGKPDNPEHAFDMLGEMVGRTHQVLTAVCLLKLQEGRTSTFVETTAVTFHALDSGQIRDYLAKIDPMDKAGSYAIQDYGDLIVRSITGSRSNVMGLPVERLAIELASF